MRRLKLHDVAKKGCACRKRIWLLWISRNAVGAENVKNRLHRFLIDSRWLQPHLACFNVVYSHDKELIMEVRIQLPKHRCRNRAGERKKRHERIDKK